MSFISGIKWHHREISPDCENDSLIVFVPKEDLPTTVELRERERKFDEEYLERRRSAAREAAAKAKAAGKKAAEAK